MVNLLRQAFIKDSGLSFDLTAAVWTTFPEGVFRIGRLVGICLHKVFLT